MLRTFAIGDNNKNYAHMKVNKLQATHSLSAPNIKGVWLILAFIASSILGYASPHDNTASRVSAPDGKYTIEYTATQKISPKLKGHSPYDKSYADPECDFKVISHTFDPSTGIGVITLDRPIKVIAVGAFAQCDAMTSITIPDSVTKIKDGAFTYCEALVKVEIPESVTEIGTAAFIGCESLSEVRLPSKIEVIADELFAKSSSLKHITIPEGVTAIGSGAFHDCESLQEIEIPESVTSIGYNPLFGCDALTHIRGKYATDDQLALIVDGHFAAFANGRNIASYTIPSEVRVVNSGVMFGNKYIESITIHENVEVIECGAFDCLNLKRVTCYATTPPLTKTGNLTMSSRDINGREYYEYVPELYSVIDIHYIFRWSGLGPISDYKKRDLIIYIPEGSMEEYSTASGDKLYDKFEGWSEYKGYFQEFAPECCED